MPAQKNPNLIVAALTGIALVAMIAAYFSPIWWVSLTAPNYPKDAFPDGIRIHFHFDGVYNGCKAAGAGTRMAEEIIQKDLSHEDERYNPITGKSKDLNKDAQGLDCVHEMNTINHYVGMYPIATGAPVELRLSKFIFGFFAVMLLGFDGDAASSGWSSWARGSPRWPHGWWLTRSSWAIWTRSLPITTRRRLPSSTEPEVLANWVANLKFATYASIAGLVCGHGRRPARRVEDCAASRCCWRWCRRCCRSSSSSTYAGWLWFFGHNLHPWGAFTVKPFMPTVFGDGKVAQFSTYSYPYWGYALLLRGVRRTDAGAADPPQADARRRGGVEPMRAPACAADAAAVAAAALGDGEEPARKVDCRRPRRRARRCRPSQADLHAARARQARRMA